jgi:NAD(P)H-hydrate epimerase
MLPLKYLVKRNNNVTILLTLCCTARFLGSFSFTFSNNLFPISQVRMSSMSYVDAKTAQNIDNKLMSTPGFSIDQLMELAGLSVAQATHDFYTQTYKNPLDATSRKVLVFCGPGNNGGDGLVAARHLKHFGYTPSIVYPKQGKGDLFINLVKQCIDLDIEISRHEPSVVDYKSFNMVVDALFGFSFQGPIREPFGAIIQRFAQEQVPVISVDIPSGWDVDNGDTYNTGFDPDAVISLTLPKLCMQQYRKTHYVGGRFVPPSLALEMGLTMPDYGYGPAQVCYLICHESSSFSETLCSSIDHKSIS